MSNVSIQSTTTFFGPLLPVHQPKSTGAAAYSHQLSPNRSASSVISDDTLMFEVLQGRDWALEELYTRYYRYAYSLAFRILQENTATEDLVQEVFLTVWRKAGLYKQQQGGFLRWLQAIVHHRAIDKIRATTHKDQRWMPLQIENEQDPACEQPDVWEEAWRNERRRLLRLMLEQIPIEQRIVIECCYFRGMTHLEISQRWNLPLGTVKGRLRLGLQKMKQLLHERDMDERV